jgi:hypothetical protein
MSNPSVPDSLKRIVAERATGCCEYCLSQVKFSSSPFSVEHIIPRTKGGTNALTNLALSCLGCNYRKFTATQAPDPFSGKLVSMYHPRLDDWAAHFQWNTDFTLIVGLTPTGRATIEKLQLNRDEVVNLRRVLLLVGKHPPR